MAFPEAVTVHSHSLRRARKSVTAFITTRDGRFLINTVLDDAAAPITLLQNWNPRLEK